jgi:hypothetical protein
MLCIVGFFIRAMLYSLKLCDSRNILHAQKNLIQFVNAGTKYYAEISGLLPTEHFAALIYAYSSPVADTLQVSFIQAQAIWNLASPFQNNAIHRRSRDSQKKPIQTIKTKRQAVLMIKKSVAD